MSWGESRYAKCPVTRLTRTKVCSLAQPHISMVAIPSGPVSFDG
jgi:hypothetical protein